LFTCSYCSKWPSDRDEVAPDNGKEDHVDAKATPANAFGCISNATFRLPSCNTVQELKDEGEHIPDVY
jgi:hypothetical protein